MDKPTITRDQAVARAEQIIRDAVAILDPKPRLEFFMPSLNDHGCVDPSDGGSEDRIVITRSYFLRDIPKERLGDIGRQVKNHWDRQGHRITEARGFEISVPFVTGYSRPDDFIISLSWAKGDLLDIGATSPCIWPNGTPPP